jgi:hypothetical protein
MTFRVPLIGMAWPLHLALTGGAAAPPRMYKIFDMSNMFDYMVAVD